MQSLIELVEKNEEWLMGRILDYAKERGYTKYTSTLKEAWRLSISGLSESLLSALNEENVDLELSPDDDYTDDPATKFGVLAAVRHRQRGVSLAMFLGLMKYYRESYLDLVKRAEFGSDKNDKCMNVLNRFFDRIEIGFSVEWSSLNDDQMIRQLQDSNRKMTNQKNKYLTIFESFPHPAILLDTDKKIENMNSAAAKLISDAIVSGDSYYHKPINNYLDEDNTKTKKELSKLFPWIDNALDKFSSNEDKNQTALIVVPTDDGTRDFSLHYSIMRDVSDKFNGYVVMFEDITERQERNKLQAAIETAGAVCHEFNQPLQALSFKLELLAAKNTGNVNDLKEMLNQTNKLGEITRKLSGITEYKTKHYFGRTSNT